MKQSITLITTLLITYLFLSSNICLAMEISSIQVAEGMSVQDVEKSLGVKRKKKKKSKKTKVKSNSDEKHSEVNVDRLLQELDGSQEKSKNTNNNDKVTADNSADSVVSIGVGNMKSMPYAEAIVINKITTKSQTVIFKTEHVKFFGNLSVEIHKCINDPSDLKPNNMMLMTIFDNKIDDDKLSVFHGWMMSNNLSVSTLEHPVYDIIPVKCHAKRPDN